jgi:hypothetical protein
MSQLAVTVMEVFIRTDLGLVCRCHHRKEITYQSNNSNLMLEEMVTSDTDANLKSQPI